MDPCPFIRLVVESLALKPPMASKSARPDVHPSTTPCFCTLQLQDHPSLTQTALLPLAIPSTTSSSTAAVATLKKTTFAISTAQHASQAFLSMMCHMRAGIFFFFGSWIVVMGLYLFVVFLLPETKNVPIDEMVDKVWKKQWYWKRYMDDENYSQKDTD